MFAFAPLSFPRTPVGFKRVRRKTYPTLVIRPPRFSATCLIRGFGRKGGRGLTGRQTVFSKGAWAARTKFHSRVLDMRGLYSLHVIVGFLPRPRNLAHSAVMRSSLGGYVLAVASQFHTLFSFCQAAPDSPLAASVVWAQKSWWWRLALLAPHTNVSRIPVLGGAGFYSTAGGSSSLFISGNLWGAWAFILLPSGQPKFVLAASYVFLGSAHPLIRARRPIILAGDGRRLGQKPQVRGTVKNPNDHPNGGRTRTLRLSQTPWARPAKKSRKPRLNFRLKPLGKRSVRQAQAEELDTPMFIGQLSHVSSRVIAGFSVPQRALPYVGYRSFRILALASCQHRARLDSFLSARFLSFLLSDRLCYMTQWFSRAPRLSLWFGGEFLRVYRGRKWRGLRLTSLHKGQPLGALARTKILAVFQQAKTRKKRAKAAAAKAASTASQQRMDQARRFKGRGGRAAQGLRVLNRAFLGSKWLNTALVEGVE